LVPIPGPVAVIPSQKAISQLMAQGPIHPQTLVDEMGRLSAVAALPARVDTDRNRLVVYTDRFVAWLYPTQRNDAYSLGHVARLTFKDQERLLDGALSLAGTWHAFQHVRDVPDRWSSHWRLIWQAWQAVAAQRPQPALPSHHASYLDMLTEVVEATRDIEIEKQRTARPVPYRRRGSTREERYSARGVYAFELLRPATLTAGAPVYVLDQTDLRGRVVRVKEREVVVRFESPVDYKKLPAQGALQVMPSDRVYRAQLEAIDTLRHGRAANPYLLWNLVDRRQHAYQPDSAAQPRVALDPGQRAAFQRALTVPDQLLVLGPPGTGKTRTITEVAAGCAARGERVLVTSHTNRAVDNVLEQLPPDLLAVRVGNEDAMTRAARRYMVDSQVAMLREQILANTEGTASRLAELAGDQAVAARWLDYLSTSLTDAQAADAALTAAEQARDAAYRRATAPLAEQVSRATAARQGAWVQLDLAEREHARWRRRYEWAARRAEAGPFRRLFGWLAARWAHRLQLADQALPGARSGFAAADAAYRQALTQADELAAPDPEVIRLTVQRDTATRDRDSALGQVAHAAGMLRSCLQSPWSGDQPQDLAGWALVRDQLASEVGLVRQRASLLEQWRARIREADQELHRELIQYADVVAATCIGTATAELLAELRFDIAIVDEAGQISTPNLLVPLVRARRGVLVGDHKQLPPFLDDEVKGWIDSVGNSGAVPPRTAEEIGELLRKSAFERLYVGVGDDHRVMLTVQRRMPEPLARFVSSSFYGGILETDHTGRSEDPIFKEPLAMIDTADQPAGRRAERPVQRSEEWGLRGFTNPLEAELIAELVGRYRQSYADWAVIVPYRAQVKLVAELLTTALGGPSAVVDNVGTVDSFQGGERDLIVYGFTRSNSNGEVGFLRELRRINVAITRARNQLVLVGDSTTLRSAKDDEFRALMRSLIDYLGHSGDLRASQGVRDSLARMEEGA
jgi:hypothetical protein